MKPTETIFKAKKRYVTVMILCFLYGGFAIIMSLFLIYASIWMPGGGLHNESLQNGIGDLNNLQKGDGSRGMPFMRPPFDPIQLITSPLLLTFLGSGIIALLAGITILSLVREKEIKSIKKQTVDSLLLPDEKALIETLKKFNYELTQSQLAKESGLTKVQVHRAIKKLEDKGVIEKHNYGLTNKIILKKELIE